MPTYQTVAVRHVLGRLDGDAQSVGAWRVELVQLSGPDAKVPYFAKVEQGYYRLEEGTSPRDLAGADAKEWDAHPGVSWRRDKRITMPAQARYAPAVAHELSQLLSDLSTRLEGSSVEEAVLEARLEQKDGGEEEGGGEDGGA